MASECAQAWRLAGWDAGDMEALTTDSTDWRVHAGEALIPNKSAVMVLGVKVAPFSKMSVLGSEDGKAVRESTFHALA